MFAIERRRQAQSMVTADLRQAFAVFTWWTSFINVPYFFSIFHNPDRRSSSAMQPALVLAALALSVFLTGSEAEGGQASREKAGMLRDLAQAALESSLAVGWIDYNLAKAAWVREENITVLRRAYFANHPTSSSLCTRHNHMQPTRFSHAGRRSDFLTVSSEHLV